MTDTLERPPAGTASAGPRVAPGMPRPLLVVAAGVLGLGVAVTLAGAWRTGVSWDETYHVLRLRNFLAHGWYLLDGDLDHGRPGAWEDQRYVYGPAATLLLHGWSVLWGTESWATVSTSAHAYAVRHVGVALVSLVGVGATAALAHLVVRRRGVALLAAAVLVAVPTWTGHAMFNVKDVPVATGYTLVTLGVALLVSRSAGTTTGRLTAPAAFVLLLAGCVLAVGTRPGIWPGLALAFGLGALTRDRTRLATLVTAGSAAVVLLVLLYPAAFADPVVALLGSVSESSHFDGKQGQWWYLPVFLLVELPTVLVAAGAAGTWLAVRALPRADGHRRVLLGLVLAQAFALPAIAVVGRSNLYTGLRQLLFAAPGLAVIVTLAVSALVARPGRWRTGAAVATLVVPAAAAATLFPYVYAYSSALSNLVDPVLARDRPSLEVQTDYWRTSVRELAPRIPVGGFVTCSPTLRDGAFWRRSDESADDCSSSAVGPLAPYDDLRATSWTPASPTEFLAVRTGNGTVAGNCTRIAEVTRRLYWRRIVLSTVSRCELPLERYPDGGARFDGTGEGAGYLLGGWSLHHTERGAVLHAGRSGELGFRVDTAGARRLDLEGSGLAGARVSVNGTPLALTPSPAGVTTRVPPDAAAAYGAGRVVVRITAGDADLHLLGLVLRGECRPVAGC